ncbi:RNA dependent RNA polymerase-domain-containing protein [Thelonectria olida]|uniref:RNA-dependent RNA polymerase n=1 Tax=Thelonectria olida TaxID=1576542 RepID=A0A9P8WHK2_9HYPO|nr:RNA dependent RNA polymerase-domain-containing protein [Thelonectria olida]
MEAHHQPSGKQAALDRTILSLNTDFNLHLQVPDQNLPPSKRRLQVRTEEQERVDKIYNRAHCLIFQDPGHLSTSIGRFRNQAEDLIRSWTIEKKQHADTPTSFYDDPHSVSPGVEERAALQKLLLSLLEHKTLNPSRFKPAPAPAPKNGSSKRASREFPSPEPKRCKDRPAQLDPSCRAESVDDIPVRTKASIRPPSALSSRDGSTVNGDGCLTSFTQSRPSFASRSMISSRASFAPSVFSTTTRGDISDSQTTVQTNFDSFAYDPESLQSSRRSFRSRQYDGMQREVHPPNRVLNYSQEMVDVRIPASTTLTQSQPAPVPLDPPCNIWPKFPSPALNQAPLILIWELTRAAAYCNVDLTQWNVPYRCNESWHNQTKFRAQIISHPLFIGKGLPPSCDSKTWTAALETFTVGPKMVGLVAELDYNEDASGPPFILKFCKPSLKLGNRLSRRFGADRFLEILLPARNSKREKKDREGLEEMIQWLTGVSHYFAGRTWIPFYTNEGKKTKKKGVMGSDEDPWNPDTKKARNIVQDRVYLFAGDGNQFRMRQPGTIFPPLEEALSLSSRTKMKLCDLLSWAVSIEKNAKQPITKLFSRLALSLSSTWPTVVLEREQIHRRGSDIKNEDPSGKTGKVMNDGIGRMSRSLARKVSSSLGLSDTPCGFQARIGSAKGMWIVDTEDGGLDDKDWIETYPSQEKWDCDFLDIYHRTFEVRDYPRELRTASLNQQFIPVLEAQSPEPGLMRKTLGKLLVEGLQKEIDEQREAMNHPMDFRSWLKRAGPSSEDQATHGIVPFVGGLPDRDEDTMAYLLDAGFQLDGQRFLHDLAISFRRQQMDKLKDRMKIQVPRSTYAFMVVDFTGELAEGEVQLAFSSKFQLGEDSDTLLDGIDVLVARSPAHFASDIQKVKAVFKPSLRKLKDVIVFSVRGDTPLADLLSGGDYDGDRAWVCWDPEIVRNFNSSPVPDQPDLIGQGYIRKFDTSVQSIIDAHNDMDSACASFMRQAMAFNMQPPMLGICTNFKERHCYFENSVTCQTAVVLCTLVGFLVDQSKQGLLFTDDDFKRLKADMSMKSKELEYSKRSSTSYANRNGFVHILDYLKFDVALAAIEKIRERFNKSIDLTHVHHWDPDLVQLFKELEKEKDSRTMQALLKHLRAEIDKVADEWSVKMAPGQQQEGSEYNSRVKELFDAWTSIEPPPELKHSKLVTLYCEPWKGDPARSKWALLKASMLFKLHYKRQMTWRLAGQQLCWIKAMVTSAAAGGSAVAVTPQMWSVLKPDSRKITALAAGREDNESIQALEETMEFDDEGLPFDDA